MLSSRCQTAHKGWRPAVDPLLTQSARNRIDALELAVTLEISQRGVELRGTSLDRLKDHDRDQVLARETPGGKEVELIFNIKHMRAESVPISGFGLFHAGPQLGGKCGTATKAMPLRLQQSLVLRNETAIILTILAIVKVFLVTDSDLSFIQIVELDIPVSLKL